MMHVFERMLGEEPTRADWDAKKAIEQLRELSRAMDETIVAFVEPEGGFHVSSDGGTVRCAMIEVG